MRIGSALTPWLDSPLANLAPDATVLSLLDVDGTVRLTPREEVADHDDHGDVDPHAWLDPANGAVWLGAIADTLSLADPANAATYARNARKGRDELAALDAQLQDRLSAMRGIKFATAHDALQYFETHYGLQSSGSLSDVADVDPGPARVAALRDLLATGDVACILTEPLAQPGVLVTITQGTDVRLIEVDELGALLPEGPAMYPAILDRLGAAVADCV